MPALILEHDNHPAILAAMAATPWTVACLCAGWCGTCTSYRASFDALADKHPDLTFVWIDIEDQADVVGDLDIENFPTLLLQQGATVSFLGTVLPDPQVAERLIRSHTALSAAELARIAAGTPEQRAWQEQARLGDLIRAARV
ncbi:thioredoxin family protein [Massilia sp. TS11]|uniref:thioredoxin family protein n=1 Tax=Massilia sp. TS11 TaxID=2908003 RepID=UPI001EDA1731|nr:thioredoxin family protein [Massilia sp. TS11]MCG2584256.1 thioredoxin family protein [Massilia sp. TS11]